VTSNMSASVQEPVLNHIMKQINSLKVENLELKKMISQNGGGRNDLQMHGRRSSKNVRISSDFDMPSIKSTRSKKSRESMSRSSVGFKNKSIDSRTRNLNINMFSSKS